MDFAQQLGRRMRRARIERGITQSELASSAGVGANYIPRLERGELVPSVEAAFRIARALGMSLDALCGHGSKHDGDAGSEALARLHRDDVAALRRVADIIDKASSLAKRPARKTR